MTTIDLQSYDQVIVAFSGGKDSIASFLSLLEAGVPTHKIELWHHDIDGREEGKNFMDWPATPAYCRKFAAEFGVPIFFSWREGGFLREMMRNQTATSQTHFKTPEGLQSAGGKSGRLGTWRMFPQVSANLSVRWCSAYLKVDVASLALSNQPRFHNSRTLVVSGERAAESAARAKYATFEPDRSDASKGKLNPVVDRYRPVHAWSEKDVWAIIERFNINTHPAYRLGWGQLSCALCIFGQKNQWASAAAVFPDRVIRVAELEQEFGKTIDRTSSVLDKMAQGVPYASITADLIAEANDENWDGHIRLNAGKWQLPAGAFGECHGPN